MPLSSRRPLYKKNGTLIQIQTKYKIILSVTCGEEAAVLAIGTYLSTDGLA
jgi:hypothetical protein